MWKKIERNQNYSINERGQVRNDSTGKILSQNLNKSNGYLMVSLWKDNEGTNYAVHRLLAEAFIPNPENKPTVDHKDGNRQNNRLTNLRWATYAEQNSRFNTNGVRSQIVKASQYEEIRNPRGGGHVAWGKWIWTLYFNSVGAAADYFGLEMGNISQMKAKGTIGRRGKLRGWKIEYVDSIGD